MTRTWGSDRMLPTFGTEPTCTIRSPSIYTSPQYGSAPVESRIFTSRNRIFESGRVPGTLSAAFAASCKLNSSTFYLIVLRFELRIEVDVVIDAQLPLRMP